jgi:hypothetical protein
MIKRGIIRPAQPENEQCRRCRVADRWISRSCHDSPKDVRSALVKTQGIEIAVAEMSDVERLADALKNL